MASGSGWNLWVWLVGVVVRRYIDFLILLIPTPLVSVLFCSSIPQALLVRHHSSVRPIYNLASISGSRQVGVSCSGVYHSLRSRATGCGGRSKGQGGRERERGSEGEREGVRE